MWVCNLNHCMRASSSFGAVPSTDPPRFQLTSQIGTNKYDGNGMMTDPYPHPLHMKVVNHLVCLEWMWELFHVGMEPQPLQHEGL
jgi:hypothetical protein